MARKTRSLVSGYQVLCRLNVEMLSPVGFIFGRDLTTVAGPFASNIAAADQIAITAGIVISRRRVGDVSTRSIVEFLSHCFLLARQSGNGADHRNGAYTDNFGGRNHAFFASPQSSETVWQVVSLQQIIMGRWKCFRCSTPIHNVNHVRKLSVGATV